MLAKLQKVFYEKGDYSICSFKPHDERELPVGACSKYGTFTGTGYRIPHCADMDLELSGDWRSSKYGLQLEVKSCISILPRTEEGIISFLSSGVLPYVKHKTALRLYSAFGNNIFSVMEKDPEQLLKVRGITKKKLNKIIESYKVNFGYQELVMWLCPQGISVNKIKKIADRLGSKATEIVKNNPYELFKIDGFGFKTVDNIALKTSVPKNDPLRIMGALKFILSEAQSNGDLCVKQEELRKKAYSLLNDGYEPQIVTLNEITDVIIDMARNGLLKGDNGYAYLSYNYDNEKFSAEKIKKLIFAGCKTVDVSKYISDFEARNFKLADNQKKAIEQVFANSFSIITGGPGTGKSTVLKAIIDIAKNHDKKTTILLLAPTGKAARRMSEATGEYASTIHSALHISERVDRESITPVEYDYVIVDEVSMCDMKIFSLLIAAIDPKRTKLVLVGDSDQLPSVGAGNVLNELINCGMIPTTRLDLIYRQGKGSLIPHNAHSVNNGVGKLLYDESFVFLSADEQQMCFDKVLGAYIAEVSRVGVENVCILCPIKSKGINSVNEYNKSLQDIVNPPSPEKAEINVKGQIFRVGDRVMQTKNSEYVSNGETGIIVSVDRDEDDIEFCVIHFDGKEKDISYYSEEMTNIELAYSITIHKSQGSEYKSVIIPLLNSYYVMLKRNLVYTAITRAKEKVVMAGQKKALFIAVAKADTNARATQLGNRIRNEV